MITNKLVLEANEILKNGGFDYAFCGGQALDMFLGYESRVHGDIDICAFWNDRDKIIQYMMAHGYKVFEMFGGGRAHPVTETSKPVGLKKNIFCCLEGCPLVKTYPVEEDGNCWMEFFHVGQTELDYIEFLFNEKTADVFEYSRNSEITLELEKAIRFCEGIPYLAPEMILLYKSTDIEREGYQQDFELAYKAMDDSQKTWLQNALKKEYPDGHKWLQEAGGLICR